MKTLLQFLRTTLVGGVLFLVPVIVLVVVIGKGLVLVNRVAEPLAEHLPVPSLIGLKAPLFLAIFLLVFFSFLAGVLAKTALLRRAHDRLEKSVMSNVPGYNVMKLMGEGMLGVENEKAQPVVFIRFDGYWQLGFLAERLADGLVAVHIPNAMTPHSGDVFFVAEDRVVLTKIPAGTAIKVLRNFGHGSRALLGDHVSALKAGAPVALPPLG
jgi:uncharacterized membrane protein